VSAPEPWTLIVYPEMMLIKGLIDSKESAEALIKALEANKQLLPSRAATQQPEGRK